MPDAVELQVEDSQGHQTTYSGGDLINPSPGAYSYTLIPNVAGVWSYRWSSSGSIVAAQDWQFAVQNVAVRSHYLRITEPQ